MLGKLWKAISKECKEVYQEQERVSRAQYKAETQAWTEKTDVEDDLLPDDDMMGLGNFDHQPGGMDGVGMLAPPPMPTNRSKLLPQGSCKDGWRS